MAIVDDRGRVGEPFDRHWSYNRRFAVNPGTMGTYGLNAVTDFNAVGDGVTDNTASLQAWLDAIAGSSTRGFGKLGYLPPGWYKTGPLAIRRACRVTGGGPYASVLDLKTGAVGPTLTISCAYDNNNYASSYGDPMITLDNIHLTGNKNDFLGNPTGSAIKLVNATTNFIRPNIKLINVTIDGMPYRAIEANAATGALEAIDCWFDNCKEDIVNAVSCNDWQFTNCIFGVANQDNLSLTNCGQFIFVTCNFFSAVRNNFRITGTGQNYFYGCSFDRAAQHGVYYDSSVGAVVFTNCYFNINSNGNANVYSDFYVTSAVTVGPKFVGCNFDQTYAAIPASKFSKWNIEFASGGTAHIVGGTTFDNISHSSLDVTTVSNAPSQLTGTDLCTIANPEDGVTVKASAGFRGLTVQNSSGLNLAQLKGGSASNQNGILQLFKADGTVGAQIVPQTLASFAPGTLLLFPGPYANDAAAAAASVPLNYAYRQTGGNLVWRQV